MSIASAVYRLKNKIFFSIFLKHFKKVTCPKYTQIEHVFSRILQIPSSKGVKRRSKILEEISKALLDRSVKI